MALPQLRPYLTQDAEELLGRLADIGTQVISMLGQIAMVEGQRHEARLKSFRESTEASVAAREREGEQNSLHVTLTLYELKADLEALYEEQRFVRLCYDTVMEGLLRGQ